MIAKEVMSTRVLIVDVDAPILEAVRMMLQHRISGLPVTKNGKLVGMVTEGDFMRRAEIGTEQRRPKWLEFLLGPGRLAAEYVHAAGRKVSEVMTAEPVTALEDTPLSNLVDLMQRKGIKRVPILRGDEIVGIVTRADMMRAIARLARQAAPAKTGSDSEIRERLLAELDTHSWGSGAGVTATVKDGVVELNGTILDERQRQAIIVAAENIPGVCAVLDKIVWIEPLSGTAIEPRKGQ
jgi:CBS domain-containing protein